MFLIRRALNIVKWENPLNNYILEKSLLQKADQPRATSSTCLVQELAAVPANVLRLGADVGGQDGKEAGGARVPKGGGGGGGRGKRI